MFFLNLEGTKWFIPAPHRFRWKVLGVLFLFSLTSCSPTIVGERPSQKRARLAAQNKSTPALSYAGATGTSGTVGVAMSITPTTISAGSGATVQSCAIKAGTPALPSGLSLNSSTCVISGTPSVAAATASYTVQLTSSLGQSVEASVSLSITALPVLASVTVNNSTPTNSTTYALSYGAVTGGVFSEYCIRENSIDSSGCSWVTGSTLPGSFTVSGANGAKTLSVWMRNSLGGVSARVDSNSVTLDTVAPGMPSGIALKTPANTPGLSATPVFTVSGVTSGDTVAIYTSDSCALPSLKGSAVVATGESTVDVTSLSLSVGAYAFYSDSTDPAGNRSACSSVASLSASYERVASAANLSITSHTSPHNFGSVAVGSTQNLTLTLSNSGGITASSIASGGISGVFSRTGGTCGLSLASGATCTIILSFAPLTVASSSQTLGITYTDALSTAGSLNFDLSGTGTSTPALSYAGATGTSGTVGVAMSITPTTISAGSGATVQSCAIKAGTPALPSGLSLNSSTCVISGTPRASAATASYRFS